MPISATSKLLPLEKAQVLRMKKLIILFLVTFGLSQSIVASEEDCSKIQNADKRLACFDEQFDKNSSTKPAEKNSDKDSASTTDKPRQSPGNRMKSLFDWEGAEPFVSTIMKIRSRDKQRMVFLLENDQIWIQTEPRPQPFREGEQVSIKAGLMGGFNMRSQSGAFSRVRRIQ
jgi:hypothetical protein